MLQKAAQTQHGTVLPAQADSNRTTASHSHRINVVTGCRTKEQIIRDKWLQFEFIDKQFRGPTEDELG
jgi:hypothetical protein